MSDPRTTAFSEQVHRVVALVAQGASGDAIRDSIDSTGLDTDELAALWLLADSLRAGRRLHSAESEPAQVLAHA